jgi:hypothetical protein
MVMGRTLSTSRRDTIPGSLRGAKRISRTVNAA